MLKLKQLFYRWKYRFTEPEMVHYWKTKDSVQAKLMRTEEGHYVMQMQGEKYPFSSYPRGSLLFGSLSPLKHMIKNEVFNAAWKELEEQKPEKEIHQNIKKALDDCFSLDEKNKLDHVPFECLNPPVKELWRAMTVVEQETGSDRVRKLKEVLCFILQEDDAYRFRTQWLIKFFNPRSWWRRLLRRDPIVDFDYALSMIEHAEMVGDMKERERLLRRVLICALRDPSIRLCFKLLCKEMDWNKLKLTKADKYFFRAKYFKVDYPEYQY